MFFGVVRGAIPPLCAQLFQQYKPVKMKTIERVRGKREDLAAEKRQSGRLSPVGCWLRQAVLEVEKDKRERASGRPGVLKVQSLDELFAELHA